MFKYLILVTTIHYVVCNEFGPFDDMMAKGYRIGDPNHLLAANIQMDKMLCSIQMADPDKKNLAAIFERSFQDSPMTLEILKTTLVMVENAALLPSCKVIEKEGEANAKAFFDKIDSHVNEAKKLRDQFVTALEEASDPQTATTLPQLACFGRLWVKKTLEVYPESEKAFIKDYIRVIETIFDCWDKTVKERGLQAVDSCELLGSAPQI